MQSRRIRYALALLAFLWVTSCVYLNYSNLNLIHKEACDQCSGFKKTVDDLIIRVERVNHGLEQSLDSLTGDLVKSIPLVKQETRPTDGPFASHELLRRRALHYTQEMWYTVSGQLRLLASTLKGDERALKSLQQVQNQVGEITRLLEVDIHGLGRVDGAAQRQAEGLQHLGELLNSRLEALQNPKTGCSTARFLLVKLNRPCAFGCNVHHLVYCFIFAYASRRTLLFVHSDGYTDWWMKNFLPLSSQCSLTNMTVPKSAPYFTDSTLHSQAAQFLSCPYIGDLNDTNRFLPQAVPSDLATPLARLHGAPFVWFAGQLLAFVMRPTSALSDRLLPRLADAGVALPNNRRSPVVGVHVRRSDKIVSEAQFHNLTEYMVHVERFFDMIDDERRMIARTHEWQGDINPPPSDLKDGLVPPVPRKVYLATDDPNLFKEASLRYPNYQFFGDANRAKLASKMELRNGAKAIFDITLDIIILSKTDYLVCTFSSQVCRVAYELMQTRARELGDSSWRFHSLDDGYYFGGQQKSVFETLVLDQQRQLSYGELVKITGNHWDGFAMVDRNGRRFLAPAYKFRPKLLSVPMGRH